MDSLRWTLLLIGVVIVGAIWWLGQRRARGPGESLFERARREPIEDDAPPAPDPDPDRSPEIDARPAADMATDPVSTVEAGAREDATTGPAAAGRDEVDPAAAPGAAAASTPRAGPGAARAPARDTGAADGESEERLEVVYVVAPRGEHFDGARLQRLFEQLGLEHGALGVFHEYDADGHTLFSVANLVEPGTFDPASMDTLSTPGLALFLRLPGPPSAELAFGRMIAAARGLADALEARVLDAQHSTLTRQTEQHLRDQLREFDHLRQRPRG